MLPRRTYTGPFYSLVPFQHRYSAHQYYDVTVELSCWAATWRWVTAESASSPETWRDETVEMKILATTSLAMPQAPSCFNCLPPPLTLWEWEVRVYYFMSFYHTDVRYIHLLPELQAHPDRAINSAVTFFKNVIFVIRSAAGVLDYPDPTHLLNVSVVFSRIPAP